MSSRSSETWHCTNGTCAEKVEHVPPPLSSTFALSLLGVAIIGIVALSLTTHHFHKGKMKKRKIQRAQEEYERDQRSPVPTAGKEDPRRSIIARPAGGHTDPIQPPADDSADRAAAFPTHNAAVDSEHLQAVVVS